MWELSAELSGETARYFSCSCTLREASSCRYSYMSPRHTLQSQVSVTTPGSCVYAFQYRCLFTVWFEQSFTPRHDLQHPDTESSSPRSVCHQGKRHTELLSHPQLLYAAQNGVVTSFVTLAPKSQPAPRGLMAHVSTSSGSDQTRSQKAPLWGIS